MIISRPSRSEVGSFSKPILSSNVCVLNAVPLSSLCFLRLCTSRFFQFLHSPFLFLFVSFVPLSYQGSWVFYFSFLSSIELMSIMGMFSCYCRSCCRNSVRWLVFEINLHQLLAMGTNEVSGDVMMCGQYLHISVECTLTCL